VLPWLQSAEDYDTTSTEDPWNDNEENLFDSPGNLSLNNYISSQNINTCN